MGNSPLSMLYKEADFYDHPLDLIHPEVQLGKLTSILAIMADQLSFIIVVVVVDYCKQFM